MTATPPSPTTSATDLDVALGPLWPVAVIPTSYPPLPGPVRCDVAVLGAGITGLTTAVLLARSGLSVRVLEARHIGAGTTGHSSAKVTLQHGLVWDRLLRTVGEDGARTYAEMNRFGFSWILENAGTAQLTHTHATTWTEDRVQEGTFAREVRAAEKVGVPLRLDLAQELPFTVQAAVRLDDQAQIDPVAYLLSLAAELASTPGCAVHEHTAATGVRDGTSPVVRTAQGDVTTDHVVVATGLPFLDRSLLFARTVPHRSYVLAGRTTAPLPTGMYVNADSPTRSLRTAPDGDGGVLALVGGDGHKPAHGPDEREHLQALRVWGDERVGLGEVVASWAAQDYSTSTVCPTSAQASRCRPGCWWPPATPSGG